MSGTRAALLHRDLTDGLRLGLLEELLRKQALDHE
jgi:hypothetical protein